ncbi:SPOR domain-containing protein [Paracoccus sp. S1E-3]|uniref:SPOR domain-containing protein n=1 Tax=Paracoccus sp. S1E-3 TaxID=2756130 RepID=UPI0015EFCAAD|nr:SPOR domain-containing protein [Paracoccus sp. S1E-3]MBA4491228.1 SPOR domain-containing protein [Paracoccus sp. S1E-3]
MAVTDFGARRFADSEPRRARNYPYQHHAQDEYEEEYGWYDDGQAELMDQPESLGARFGRLTHYLGAVISVLLLIGLVVWGYKLVARDVSGVPVIRATMGEARTAPDDPGGELAQNGGLTVNEIAAGVAMPPNAEIAIAPAPTGLSEDDVAMGQLADAAALSAAADAVVPAAPQNPVVALTDAEAAAGIGTEEPADMADLGIVSAEDLTATTAEEPLAATPVTALAGTRPAPRPARIAARAPAVAAAPAERPAIEEAVAEAVAEEAPAPAPARVASGAPVVQLGAFDSDAIANKEWGRISGRFSSLFSGKSQLVQTTKKNGRTFYRLRVAGFESRDDARRFCAALLAEGADCIATQQ